MTVDEFEQRLEEQKILKWRELEENKICKIIDFYQIDTMYGDAWIIQLDDERHIFAPSALSTLLEKKEEDLTTPFYIPPTGLKQSRKNDKNEYYSFDIVFG